MHSQLIEKAKDALHTQSVENRDITSVSVSLDPEVIPLAKEEIRKFRARMKELLTQSQAPTKVYQLNIQFFELTTPHEGEPK